MGRLGRHGTKAGGGGSNRLRGSAEGREKWRSRVGVSPGDESCKSIFLGVDRGGGVPR